MELLNVNQLAEALGISVRSVWRGFDSGLLPRPVRLGKSVRLSADVLAAWIDAGCPNVRRTGWAPQKGGAN